MSAAKSPCPLDGNLRTAIHTDRYGVTWKCGWCAGVSREEYEPEPMSQLQREWDR